MKTKTNSLPLLTFLGGAIGSVLRFEISQVLPQSIWLWIVNILGALVLGFINTNKSFAKPNLQAFWGTGFAGGFTTLSSLITFTLLINEAVGGVLYLAQQIGVGVAVYWLGRFLGGERKWSK
jgi:CrcB protein